MLKKHPRRADKSYIAVLFCGFGFQRIGKSGFGKQHGMNIRKALK
jgi:hypothetical protein